MLVAILVIFTFAIIVLTQKLISKRKHQRSTLRNHKTLISDVKIVYGTQTGNSKAFAIRLLKDIKKKHNNLSKVSVLHVKQMDMDLFFTKSLKNNGENNAQSLYIFILPTYTDGEPTSDAQVFYNTINEWKYDFRVDRDALQHIGYAVFGLGDSAFGENFNKVAKNIDLWLFDLGAKRFVPTVFADVSEDLEVGYSDFASLLDSVLCGNSEYSKTKRRIQSKAEKVEPEEESDYESDKSDEENEDMLDLEDLGEMMPNLQHAVQQSRNKMDHKGRSKRDIGDADGTKAEPKSMVTPSLSKALKKQGYTILGTHSGVKVCRWTKSMLRGRGGCYKHSFYGIASHQCMETTPSLACANKCVFCWRHHTNPVGTEWKWKVDQPEEIVNSALENHYKMLKSLRGAPGVKEERFEEAMNVRHCALSLVGEPIMYPYINEFTDLLHEKRISSFLVTNAQFPEKILTLKPVTQLYVSVDAPTKESLKKVDRPLFKDFWERFLNCLDALGTKGQRTVYRLTLVKDFNTEDISKYAALVSRGRPDFIEVKGVTFCGYSGSNPLTMSNVPYQHEVVSFVKKLLEHLDGNYAIACEHAHSCSVLVADKKYFIDNKWHTWIDYEKFHNLVASGEHFTSMDYYAPTPDWAVFGAEERGFDPAETRHYRKGHKTPDKQIYGDAVAEEVGR
jgi:tRNA wybutosine-synthesizing protein 1